jgi:hypothetical protein
MITEEVKKSFEVFFRAVNREYEHQFARLMIEAIKSGDFQSCLNIPKDRLIDNNGNIRIESSVVFGLSYIPYRETSRLKEKLSMLNSFIAEKGLQDELEEFLNTGEINGLEDF